MPEIIGARSCGFFGKLPKRADFVQRDLLPSFIQVWDRWLQDGLTVSRAALGDAWLDRYLNSPIWQFALGPNIVGSAAAGVVIPSIDQVGRYFPLTLAVTLPPQSNLGALVLDQPGWFKRVEEAALLALNDDVSFEEFGTSIAMLPAPVVTLTSPSSQLARWSAPALRDDTLVRLLSAASVPETGLWWSDGTPTIPAAFLMTAGPLRADWFTALIDGEWEQRGWNSL